MNALWSSSAVFCPAGSVVVVLVEGKLVCAGLSVVVVVVVVGGFLCLRRWFCRPALLQMGPVWVVVVVVVVGEVRKPWCLGLGAGSP